MTDKKRTRPNDVQVSKPSEPEESQSIRRALTAGDGEFYTLERNDSSLIIGRAEPMPSDEGDVNDEDYPDIPRSAGDYDTWLG
jgi:hypothetical protein